MKTFELILLVLAFVLAICASAGVSHPRFNLFAAGFAAFVASLLVAMAP